MCVRARVYAGTSGWLSGDGICIHPGQLIIVKDIDYIALQLPKVMRALKAKTDLPLSIWVISWDRCWSFIHLFINKYYWMSAMCSALSYRLGILCEQTKVPVFTMQAKAEPRDRKLGRWWWFVWGWKCGRSSEQWAELRSDLKVMPTGFADDCIRGVRWQKREESRFLAWTTGRSLLPLHEKGKMLWPVMVSWEGCEVDCPHSGLFDFG